MTVKKIKRSEKAKPKRALTLSERQIFEAYRDCSAEIGGGIPSLKQIVDAVEGRIKKSRVAQIRKVLENEGYMRSRLEILEEAVA
jgi:hypothetical protein